MVSFLKIKNKIKQEFKKKRRKLSQKKKEKRKGKRKNPHPTPSLIIENNVNYFRDGPRIGLNGEVVQDYFIYGG